MQVIIVTGAQGFIGRYTVAEILASFPDALVIGCGRSQRNDETFTHCITAKNGSIAAPLPPALCEALARQADRYRYHQVDITDSDLLRAFVQRCDPTAVIHLASGLRDDDASHLVRTNIEGTIVLTQTLLASKTRLKRLVLGSSGSIYGPATVLPVHENYLGTPQDLYAVTKLAGEHASRILTNGAAFQTAWGRIFNVVGPGQEERHIAGRVASQLSAIMDGTQKPVLQLGDLRPTRDFVDVRDVAQALCLLALGEHAEGAYNIASGDESSIETVVHTLISTAKQSKDITIEAAYSRRLDVQRQYADISRLRNIGYIPKITLEQSLSDVLWVLSKGR